MQALEAEEKNREGKISRRSLTAGSGYHLQIRENKEKSVTQSAACCCQIPLADLAGSQKPALAQGYRRLRCRSFTVAASSRQRNQVGRKQASSFPSPSGLPPVPRVGSIWLAARWKASLGSVVCSSLPEQEKPGRRRGV